MTSKNVSMEKFAEELLEAAARYDGNTVKKAISLAKIKLSFYKVVGDVSGIAYAEYAIETFKKMAS